MLAGGGSVGGTSAGYVIAGGSAAKFNGPKAVAVDSSHNVYVADTGNHLIRMIADGPLNTAWARNVTTIAGGAGGTTAGFLDGTGSLAMFTAPAGIAVDSSGNIYVGDSGNNIVRVITAGGVVAVFAGGIGTDGGGTMSGYMDGIGAYTLFSNPTGVAWDGVGNIFVADTGNNLIRMISVASSAVSTVAGGGAPGSTLAGYVNGLGTAAKFNAPAGLTANANWIFVADTGNNLIRQVSMVNDTATVALLTGGGGANGTMAGFNLNSNNPPSQAGTSALLNAPASCTLSYSGGGSASTPQVICSDTRNNIIRRVYTSYPVAQQFNSPFSGGGPKGSNSWANASGFAEGTFQNALYTAPAGVAVFPDDVSPNIIIADTGNNLIRILLWACNFT